MSLLAVSASAQDPATDETANFAASDGCPTVGGAGVRSGTVLGVIACRFQPTLNSRRDALLGLANWDHSLLGAFEFSARLVQIAKLAAVPAEPRPFHPLPAPEARLSTSGTRPSINSLIASLKLNQLQRQGMNLNMNSAYGSFRMQYREIFSGRPNGLGGGVGQASAAATYTTPRFGANNMWDFSAAALMGAGSINTLLGSGFGNSAIGGNGPGRRSTGPTVALKLTF